MLGELRKLEKSLLERLAIAKKEVEETQNRLEQARQRLAYEEAIEDSAGCRRKDQAASNANLNLFASGTNSWYSGGTCFSASVAKRKS